MQKPNAYVGTVAGCNAPSREGATHAWQQFLLSGLPSLYRQAYRVLGNTADAEDAVQDALLSPVNRLDQFKAQSQISSWLTSIVLNCARMQLRSRRRHVHVAIEETVGNLRALSVSLTDYRPNPEDECKNSELRTQLTRFRARLSPALGRTFRLRAIDGLSIRETAWILGIPSGTVKAQLARARNTLKGLMRRAFKARSRGVLDRLPVSEIRQVRAATPLELTDPARMIVSHKQPRIKEMK